MTKMNAPIYVIGDVHGCFKQLGLLLEKIKQHGSVNNVKDDKIIFVGDYIDRGPDSNKVVEWCYNNPQNVYLMGNHEEMCFQEWPSWGMNGGVQTLYSYPDMEIYPEHLRWMKNLKYGYEHNNVAVAHAGIPHDQTISEASSQYLLWNRDLRTFRHDTYKYTVHGHTPMENVSLGENTAYIDTGCVFGGKLTALFIPDTYDPNSSDMDVIQVKA